MDERAGHFNSLSPPESVREICERFQSAWRSGSNPRIEDFLPPPASANRPAAFRALLTVEIALRTSGGELISADEYLRRFPEHADLIRDVLENRPTSVPASALKTGGSPADATISWNQPVTETEGGRDPAPELPPGTTLGRFQLLKVLGQGTFGTVYLAHDPQLDRKVALKVPRAGALADEEEVRRFLREARAAGQLRHPHIVPVYEACQTQHSCYIAAEYVAGETLRQRIRRGPPLSFRESARIVAQLAAALHYAHGQGIIHRDIKPENIMLSKSGEPQIMDFGLAHRDEGMEMRTREGIRMGTPAYMSPEQAAGQSHLADARSDLWALGVVLYELLTGDRPFGGEIVDLIRKILDQEPVPPRKLAHSIPRDLETICQKCLTKSPEQRYQTCGELADELDRWLRGDPIAARPIGLAERTWRWSRRNPVMAALTGTAAALLVAVAAVSTFSYYREAGLRHNLEVAVIEKSDALTAKNQALTEKTTALIDRTEALQQKTTALAQAEKDRDEAYKAQRREAIERRNTRLLLAENEFERGYAVCTQGDVPAGMLWLVRSLQTAPTDAADFRRMVCTNLNAWSRECPILRWITPPISERAPNTAQLSAWPVFSPDRSLLAIREGIDPNQNLRILQIETGTQVGSVLSSAKLGVSPDQFAFSHDGRHLAIAGYQRSQGAAGVENRGVIQIRETASGKMVGTALHCRQPNLQFSGDKKYVLSIGEKGTNAQWVEIATGGPFGPSVTHGGFVVAAVTEPATRLLVVDSDQKVRLWDMAAGKPIGEPMPNALGGQFSPNGGLFATSRSQTEVQLWNSATGAPVGGPLQHETNVLRFIFSEHASRILTRTADNTIRVWNADDGTPVGGSIACGQNLGRSELSPNGELIGCSFPDSIRVWDAASGQKAGPDIHVAGHTTSIGLTFSPDGERIVTSSESNVLQVWDARSGSPVSSALRLATDVVSASFAAKEAAVFAIGKDGDARVWDQAQGPTGLRKLSLDGDPVARVAFAADGERVVASGWHGKVRFWYTGSGEQDGAQIEPTEGFSLVLAISPDGKYLVRSSFLASGAEAQVWDASSRRAIGKPFATGQFPLAAFHPRDAKFLMAGRDNLLGVYAIDANEVTPQKRLANAQYKFAEFSADGNWVISRDVNNGTLQSWDASTGDQVGRDMAHPLNIASQSGEIPFFYRFGDVAAVSPDGRWIVSGGEDGTVRFWDFKTGAPLGRPAQHGTQPVRRVVVSRDGSRVLTGSKDGSARVWDAQSHEPLGRIVRHDGEVLSLAISGNGTLLLTSGADRTIRLWDPATGRPIGPIARHSGYMFHAAISPDSKWLVSGANEKSVRQWRAPVALVDEPERLATWVQCLTGMELDETDTVLVLDGKALEQRRRRLDQLGGAPVSADGMPRDVNRAGPSAEDDGDYTRHENLHRLTQRVTSEIDALQRLREQLGATESGTANAAQTSSTTPADRPANYVDLIQSTRRSINQVRSFVISIEDPVPQHQFDAVTSLIDRWNVERNFYLRFVDRVNYVPLAPIDAITTADLVRGTFLPGDFDEELRACRARYIGDGYEATWSPDGKRLAFGGFPLVKDIRIYDFQTGVTTKLLDNGAAPAWSPGSGKFIAFSRGPRPEEDEVWVVESSGGEPRKLADGGYPGWFPDGKRVLFHSRKENKLMSIVVDDPTAVPTPLVDIATLYPAYSPDAKWAVLDSAKGIVELDFQTGRRTVWPLPKNWTPNGFVAGISPDGETIAFTGVGISGRDGLWLLNRRTGKFRRVLSGNAAVPTWSPDGRRFAIDIRTKTPWQVWVLDAPNVKRDSDDGASTTPQDQAAYLKQGDVWFSMKEFDKALEDYSAAIRLDPKSAMAFVNRGNAWREKNDFDNALADYAAALRIDSNLAQAFRDRGTLWMNMKQFDKARDDFEEAIRLAPQDPSTFVLRGNALSNLQKYEMAVQDYDEALRFDSTLILAYFNRGLAWRSRKEFDKAIADFTEVIRLNQQWATAYANRGTVWLDKQELDKALNDFTEAIRLNPQVADVYNIRAWIRATAADERFRDGKQAVADATKACELTEWKSYSFVDTLAAAYAEAGNFAEAVKWQTKAQELAPADQKADYGTRMELYSLRKPYRQEVQPKSD